MPLDAAAVALRAEIEGFYAKQVQDMDNGRHDDFSNTFTEDCEFTPVKGGPVSHGRDEIVARLEAFAEQFAGTGQQRRHIMSMSVIDRVGEDEIAVISYATVTNTREGEPPVLHWAGDIVDRILITDQTLKIKSREVRSDSIA